MTEISESKMSCCVNKCASVAGVKGVRIFPFSSIYVSPIQKTRWIQAIQRINGTSWYPKRTSGVCSEHFISKEPHADKGNPDFAPSIFNYDDTGPGTWKKITMKQFALEYIRYDDLLQKPAMPEKSKRAYNRLAESLHITVSEVMEWETKLRNFIEQEAESRARYGHKTYTVAWVKIVEQKLKSVQAYRGNKEPATPVHPGHVILALREAAAARGMLWSVPLYNDVRRALRLPVTLNQLHIVWEKAQQASLSELTLSSRMGDWPAFAATQQSTNISDLVLLLTDVNKNRIINDESIFLYEEAKALQLLMDLIQIHQCEGDMPNRVRAQRWTRVHKDYLQRGRVASVVALQRRWHELALQARTRLASYWRRTRVKHTHTQASDATQDDLPLPAPIHIEILKQYPHIALKPFTSWRKLVASGVIIEVPLDDEALSQPESEIQHTPTTQGITFEQSNVETRRNDLDNKQIQPGSSVNISEITKNKQRNTNNNELNKNQDVIDANNKIQVNNESMDTVLNSNLAEDPFNNTTYELSIPSPIPDIRKETNFGININKDNFGDINKTVDYNKKKRTVRFNLENQIKYYDPVDSVTCTTLDEIIGVQYYVSEDQLLSTRMTLSDVSEDESCIDNNKIMVGTNNGNNSDGTSVATAVNPTNIDEISQVNSNVLTAYYTPICCPKPRYRDWDNPARATTVALDLGTLSPNEGVSEILRNTEIMLKQREQEVDFINKMPTAKQLESVLAELAFAPREKQGMVHKRCCLARSNQDINDKRAIRGDPPLRTHEHKDEKCSCCCQYLCGPTMNIKLTADRMALCDEIIAMIQKSSNTATKNSVTPEESLESSAKEESFEDSKKNSPTKSLRDTLKVRKSAKNSTNPHFSVDANKEVIDLNDSNDSKSSEENTSDETLRQGPLTETIAKNGTQKRIVSIFEPVDINEQLEKIKSPNINGTWSMVLSSDSDEECIIIDSDLNKKRIYESIYSDSDDENPNTNEVSESKLCIKTVPDLMSDKKYYKNLIKRRLKSESIDCLDFKVTTSPNNPNSIESKMSSRSTNMRQSTMPENICKAITIESTRQSLNIPTKRRKSFDVNVKTKTTEPEWKDRVKRMFAKKKPTKISTVSLSPPTSFNPIEKNISPKTADPKVVLFSISELTIKKILKRTDAPSSDEDFDITSLSDDSDVEIVD